MLDPKSKRRDSLLGNNLLGVDHWEKFADSPLKISKSSNNLAEIEDSPELVSDEIHETYNPKSLKTILREKLEKKYGSEEERLARFEALAAPRFGCLAEPRLHSVTN